MAQPCPGMMRAGLLALILLAAASPGSRAPARRTTTGVHTATVVIDDHAKFGRIVVLLPDGLIKNVHETTAQVGDTFTLTLPGAGTILGVARGPRNVGAITGGTDSLVIKLAPGATPRLWHGGHRIVVDVYNPVPGARTPNSGAPAPPLAPPISAADITLVPVTPPSPRIPPAPIVPAPVISAPAMPAPQAQAGPGAPDAAALAKTEPVADSPVSTDAMAGDTLVAQLVAPGEGAGQHAILVPFGRDVGAAAFERGGRAYVVFDASKPIDLAALKDDPIFGTARVILLPAATQIAINLPKSLNATAPRLALHRRQDGWVVSIAAPGAPPAGATLVSQNDTLAVASHMAADTVVLADPATGGKLLVGTTTADDAGVSVPHVSPEFVLLPSWCGVLLLAHSDRLAMRASKTGFVLLAATGPKLVAVAGGAAEQQWGQAADLTRRFEFTPLPAPLLLRNLQGAIAAAAHAPHLARAAPRARVAQAMLSLGMARESVGVLNAALRDDADFAGETNGRALLAMAHFLTGGDRSAALGPTEAALARETDRQAMANPALGHSDELALWRAVMGLTMPASAQAAALSATWRLLLAYPAQLQHRLAPAVARALLQGGQLDAARALTGALPDRALDGVRATLLVQAGHTAEALTLLDRLTAGADRRQAAAARRDAVELRVAAHQITPAQAAEALDRHLYAWRDEDTEIAQRLRIAALRADAGAWRHALAGLRTADTLFPQAHDRIHAAELAVVANLLQAGQAQRLPALDLVALVEESADLLGSAEASSTLAPVLADKLMALDLPRRAGPILAKLMAATDAPAPRAALGARLASLRLEEGADSAAIDALNQSDAPDLPDMLQNDRIVLRARALADSGQVDSALKRLDSVATAEALELKASLLEKRNDWHGAEAALRVLVQTAIPPNGALSANQQDMILHVAADAARAGDMAALQQLQAGDAQRLTLGGRSALFLALAQQPIQRLSDLPRSAREAVTTRGIPAALASYQAR